jgi:hypothetical protein
VWWQEQVGCKWALDTANTVIEMRLTGTPKSWIADHLGVEPEYVTWVSRASGLNFGDRISKDKYERLRHAVSDGWSLNEIHATLNLDHRQVRRYFPEYAGVERGSEEHRELTRMGRKMRELEERQW